jgi:hypothetical protein
MENRIVANYGENRSGRLGWVKRTEGIPLWLDLARLAERFWREWLWLAFGLLIGCRSWCSCGPFSWAAKMAVQADG